MAATVTTSGSWGEASGTIQEVLNVLAALSYMPEVVGYTRNFLTDRASVIWVNPSNGAA